MMMRTLGVGLLVMVCCACGGTDEAPAVQQEQPGNEPNGAARTLEIPGGGTTSVPSAAAPLSWESPDGWEPESPASNMRWAQYRVPGAAGDGECVVFYFGPGQGGDPMANAQRWAGQFTQPDGSSSVDKMQVTHVEDALLEAVIVDVTGTYDGGMTMTAEPAQSKSDWMLLGGIVIGPDAPWFFKLTGPRETIESQRAAFTAMMRSVQVGD